MNDTLLVILSAFAVYGLSSLTLPRSGSDVDATAEVVVEVSLSTADETEETDDTEDRQAG